jgi:hypothetical protein
MKSKYTKLLLIIIVILTILIILYNFLGQSYKFGNKIGTFHGVTAYSNQRHETKCKDANYYNGIYTGIKWQCVEFVRRYLIIKHGVTFSDVASAFEIPNAQFTTLKGSPIQMKNDLKVGSIIIFPKSYKNNLPDGHVSIVSNITLFGITVVEQNYIDDQFTRFIKNKDLKNVTILSLPV